MEWFTALDPQLQGTIIGGSIGGAAAVLVVALGGIGWLVRYRLQASDRKHDLRRIKMQHVMERLIEAHDWAVQDESGKASHPGDHILWLCEVYGESEALNTGARGLRDACNAWAALRQRHLPDITVEVHREFDAVTERFNRAHEATRAETLKILRSLA